jgi:hypothetical protein
MPLLKGLLLVTTCNRVIRFSEETGGTEFATLVACSPNAEDRKKKIAAKVSVESSEECFILIVDFLAGR